MIQSIRVFDGRFGRLKLIEVKTGLAVAESAEPQVLYKLHGADLTVAGMNLAREQILFFNPGTAWEAKPQADGERS